MWFMSDFIDIFGTLTFAAMSTLLTWKILKAAFRFVDGSNRRKGPPTHPLPATGPIETSRRSKKSDHPLSP